MSTSHATDLALKGSQPRAGALRHGAALFLPLPPLPTFLVGGSGLQTGRGTRIVGETIPAFPAPPSCSFDHLVGAGEERLAGSISSG